MSPVSPPDGAADRAPGPPPDWRAHATPVALAPPSAGALSVVRSLKAAGFEAWLVGGGVRDRLLGRPASDWDVASDAEPAAVVARFAKVIATGLQHGTVTVMAADEPIEVTTYRVEAGYSDGRRPDAVAFTRSLVDDLSRRDFTMNALAWDPEAGLLVDPFGGQADLAARCIRCVGVAAERFGEDGLRPLRAVRFAATLGFGLEAETAAAIPATLDTFGRIAAERIRVELVKLLLAPGVAEGLHLLRATGLLPGVVPALAALPDATWDHTVAAVAACPADWNVRLAALLWWGPEDPVPTLRTLKCANDERRAVQHLLGLRGLGAAGGFPDDPATVRASTARIGREAYPAWAALRRAVGAVRGDGAAVAAFEDRVQALGALTGPLVPKELALDGRAVAAAVGEPPSPRIGRILDALLARVWAEPAGNTAEQLTIWAREAAARLEDGPIQEARLVSEAKP